MPPTAKATDECIATIDVVVDTVTYIEVVVPPEPQLVEVFVGPPGPTGPPGITQPFRLGHTWGLVGDVSALGTLPPLFVPMLGTQSARLVGVRAKIEGGTSVEVQLLRNGVPVGSAITITQTATTTALDQALTGDDELTLALGVKVDSPSNLGMTLIIEHTP